MSYKLGVKLIKIDVKIKELSYKLGVKLTLIDINILNVHKARELNKMHILKSRFEWVKIIEKYLHRGVKYLNKWAINDIFTEVKINKKLKNSK